jgi:hypothetical protein
MEANVDHSLRRSLLVVALIALLAGAGWSIALACDAAQTPTIRSLAVAGIALFSLLAGGMGAQLARPWLASRHGPGRAGLLDR